MNAEDMAAFLVGVDHRIQYTNASCGPEWRKDLREFEDYLVSEAKRLNVDLLAEEFCEELVHKNSASGCTVLDAAQRTNKLHLFCEPNTSEREILHIFSGDDDKREEEWLQRITKANPQRLLMVCGDEHLESFARRLRSVGYAATILSRSWGSDWMFKQ